MPGGPIAQAAVALSQEADIPEVYRLAAPRLALAYALAGRAADALTVLGQVVGNTGVPLDLITCGEVYLLTGCMEEARRLTQQVLANPRHRKRRSQEARALWLLGEIAMHGNSPDVMQAETYYQQALTLAEELGLRPLQAHCHRGLGTLYATTAAEQARTALATAIAYTVPWTWHSGCRRQRHASADRVRGAGGLALPHRGVLAEAYGRGGQDDGGRRGKSGQRKPGAVEAYGHHTSSRSGILIDCRKAVLYSSKAVIPRFAKPFI